MKKTVLLNQPLSSAVAGLGHLDTLVIADAGLPIPSATQRIDLAVSQGIPPFLDVLRAVLAEMQVQGAVIASEMASHSPTLHAALLAALGDVPVTAIPHEEFKARTAAARAVVRTGEFTPYANVILIAGVTF
ncbi:MAG: D-ribose pyranase [Anaerolineae bacterium]|nr:D-ribose pyranase [Anaerolineae bacterium]